MRMEKKQRKTKTRKNKAKMEEKRKRNNRRKKEQKKRKKGWPREYWAPQAARKVSPAAAMRAISWQERPAVHNAMIPSELG